MTNVRNKADWTRLVTLFEALEATGDLQPHAVTTALMRTVGEAFSLFSKVESQGITEADAAGATPAVPAALSIGKHAASEAHESHSPDPSDRPHGSVSTSGSTSPSTSPPLPERSLHYNPPRVTSQPIPTASNGPALLHWYCHLYANYDMI